MIGQTCCYQHAIHRIVDAEFIRWLKRQVTSEIGGSLFLYYHTESMNFIIAYWVGPKYGHFQEVWNLEHKKSCSKNEARQMVKMLNRPLSGHDVAKNLLQHQRDETFDTQDKNDEQVSLDKWVNSTKLSLSMAGS